MPDIDLLPARRSQLGLLERLLQLYCHDFDTWLDEGVDDKGLYDVGFNPRRYFREKNRWAYIAYVDGRVGGFSLVSDNIAQRDDAEGRYIDEFFILRTYRRMGVGSVVATLTFDTFAGYWEVVALKPNMPAVTFWRTIIDEYSGGDYETTTTLEDDIEHVWYMFETPESDDKA